MLGTGKATKDGTGASSSSSLSSAISTRDKDGKRPRSAPKGNSNKNTKKVWFWTSDCKYTVIINIVKDKGWKAISLEKNEGKCNIYWIDVATIQERFKTVLPWQIVNHFPGMPNIARKGRMGQNLNRMLKAFPKEYSFFPRTWVLPSELTEFRKEFDNNGNSLNQKIFIVKPDAGCQGKGIFLTRTLSDIPQNESMVAQMYIGKPLLLDGYKFDLRLYALVTCIKPLRIYMFHDGLVRICTEEYVKPTKQNINNVQMHLTNYAVNKNSEGFVKPSADSSDAEGQEDASKRSLKWFMDWFEDKYGKEKAQQLWKRMGTVTVRTILSILPTLSREYDQHFKSFNNVSVKRKNKPSATSIASSSGSVNRVINKNIKMSPKRSTVDNNHEDQDEDEYDREDEQEEGKDEDNEEGGDEEEEEDGDEDGDCNGKNDDRTDHDDNNSGKQKYPRPSMRGSRCFEVLGLDIMIDKNLKAWLIEVNHLPSFGTDSPLDLDIKERLMQQVFNTIPVMPDDEEAYTAYQKEESDKRLTGERERIKALREQAEQKEKEEKERRERDRKARYQQLLQQQAARAKAAAEPPPPVVPEKTREQRIQEIKDRLLEIYTEYSPEKCSKIDKLLLKYEYREEEFLEFVIEKYGVPVPEKEVPEETKEVDPDEKKEPPVVESESEKTTVPLLVPKPPANKDQSRSRNNISSKRSSRSLSPETATTRRASAIWKTGGGESEEQFRNDIISQYIPGEDDEWILWEQQFLTQFTRIFPKPVAPKETNNEDVVVVEENEEEEEVDVGETDGNTSKATSHKSTEEEESAVSDNNNIKDDGKDSLTISSSAPSMLTDPSTASKRLTASLEDIMVEAFLQDRRQTMRMYCPLPNKARPSSETNQLPSLSEISKAPLHGTIAASLSQKGGSGWKAPPKLEKTTVKAEPTRAQMDAARRLSQGLSVKAQPGRDGKKEMTHGVMLNILQQQQHLQQMNQLGSDFDLLSLNSQIDPSMVPLRVKRMTDQHKLVRMKHENARSVQASVLRQQIYKFDESTPIQSPQFPFDQSMMSTGANNGATTLINIGIGGNDMGAANNGIGIQIQQAQAAHQQRMAIQQQQQQQQQAFYQQQQAPRHTHQNLNGYGHVLNPYGQASNVGVRNSNIMQGAGNVLNNFAKQQTVGQLQRTQQGGMTAFGSTQHAAEHAYNQYQLQIIQQQQRAREQQKVINGANGSVTAAPQLSQDDLKSFF